MPKSAEKKANAQGGIVRYRMMKKDGQLFRCMVTKKAGPKGGKTVCYKVKGKEKSKGGGHK